MKDDYRQKIKAFKGQDGEKWLSSIPSLIKMYEEKWSLQIGDPFPLSYNYVAPATQIDGTEVVFKIGFPGDKEFEEGIAALKIFNGEGSVLLLKEDADLRVVLLERLVPGNPLLNVTDDDERTRIAARVMRRLWKPVPAVHQLSYISDWGKGFARMKKEFHGTSGPLPPDLFMKAEKMFMEYVQSQSAQVVLHGDLHYDNILSSTRESWLSIDPKGIIGEPEYDTAAILRNPENLVKNPDARKFLQRRITILSDELAVNRERIRGWAFAQAILSAIWTVEDHGKGWEKDVTFAEYLLGIK